MRSDDAVERAVTARAEPELPLAHVVDAQLHQLLHDLQLLVPYDVAAAWLGHDARPALRVTVPAGAELPSSTSTRHWVFQAAAEGARIVDLFVDEGVNPQGLRSWLGVPLVLNGRRRGWIELLSSQPNLFSVADLLRVEVVVRHAATALAHLEEAAQTRNQLGAYRGLVGGLERGFAAGTLAETLDQILHGVADGIQAVAAALLLPTELAYVLGLPQAADNQPHPEMAEASGLVTEVARWERKGAAVAVARPSRLDFERTTPALGTGQVVLPFVWDDEAVGWLWLSFSGDEPLDRLAPDALQQVSAVLTAVLVWLREQGQREQQAQQSVRMLVQQVHQQRSGAITELMAGLAHELNNSLSAMLGVATLLGRDPTLGEAAQADVQLIIDQTNRIGEFVKRLANFGQLTGATKVPVKLNEVVMDTLAVVGSLAQQRSVVLHVDLPDESPVVLGNRAQLQQVCLDLLSNAVEALEASDAPQIMIEVRHDGQWALLAVSDNGYGVPDDLRDRIWTPGFTTKTAGGTRRGLGIGLPMALDIVRQHSGTIDITSQVWQGSRFTVRLPLI